MGGVAELFEPGVGFNDEGDLAQRGVGTCILLPSVEETDDFGQRGGDERLRRVEQRHVVVDAKAADFFCGEFAQARWRQDTGQVQRGKDGTVSGIYADGLVEKFGLGVETAESVEARRVFGRKRFVELDGVGEMDFGEGNIVAQQLVDAIERVLPLHELVAEVEVDADKLAVFARENFPEMVTEKLDGLDGRFARQSWFRFESDENLSVCALESFKRESRTFGNGAGDGVLGGNAARGRDVLLQHARGDADGGEWNLVGYQLSEKRDAIVGEGDARVTVAARGVPRGEIDIFLHASAMKTARNEGVDGEELELAAVKRGAD